MSSTGRLDLVATYKKETYLNLDVLNKFQPIHHLIATIIFKENGLDKPTQNLFNHLTHYLVFMIDAKVHATLTWPLHDTKAERTYRNELASFIHDYGVKGLLTPVMSSYLVNPSCYKVTVLIFQLSQLAVKCLLKTKVTNKKKLFYETVSDKYGHCSFKDFLEHIKSSNCEQTMLDKLGNHLHTKKCKEQMAELLKKKIIDWEKKTTEAREFINGIVDNFISKHNLNEDSKTEILKIKDVDDSLTYFDNWLLEVDKKLANIENDWDNKVVSFLGKCQNMHNLTESIVLRYMGQIEKSSYTIEYDPMNDTICTNDLESQINNKEKFVLRNLYINGRLNFPNLIRAFFISINFILKNCEIDDEIFNFNEYLVNNEENMDEALVMFRNLNERVTNADAVLEPAHFVFIDQSAIIKEHSGIPPLPNLSNLKTNNDQYHLIFDAFTPLNLSRHQFNLRSKTSGAFVKPQSRAFFSLLHQAPKDDFLKGLLSCRVPSYDQTIASQNSHNMSMISNIKGNETIAECASGFTRQQITRLLSTKKTSSSKKFKYNHERPDIKIKKGGLFNESAFSNESNGLFRSYSSPNLFDNQERRSFSKMRGRKLSIMQEDSPTEYHVSGIACLNSNYNTPDGTGNAESSRKLNSSNAPTDIGNILNIVNKDSDFENDLKKNVISPILEIPKIIITPTKDHAVYNVSKIETPKTNTAIIRKSNSLEKIINRYKKVRANVVQKDENEINTIVEEKENTNVNYDKPFTHRNLLPDLLSPSCSTVPVKYSMRDIDINSLEMDEVQQRKRPRESLGTALGVDQTFLDQFDLID